MVRMKRLFLLIFILLSLVACSDRNNIESNSSFGKQESTLAPVSNVQNALPSDANSSDSIAQQSNKDTVSGNDDNVFSGVDVLDKVFIDNRLNMVLTADGELYSLFGTPENIKYKLVNTGVKKLNVQMTSDLVPIYQTLDNRYYGYDANLDWIEYQQTFERPYKLLGNNMVLNERDSEAYRVNWSPEYTVSEADMDDYFSGSAADAVDLTAYVNGEKGYYVISLSEFKLLAMDNSFTGTHQDIDYDVLKFYAGAEERIGGNGYGLWYVTVGGTFHHFSGLEWNLNDVVYHTQYDGVIDFWQVSNAEAVLQFEDGLYKYRQNQHTKPLEKLDIAIPTEGISRIVPIWNIIKDDGGEVPNPYGYISEQYYLLIDKNGKLVR